jgi:hypothetical protein
VLATIEAIAWLFRSRSGPKDLPDICLCTPLPRVFIFPIFYQAGEGINSMCSVKSYCKHTTLILHRLTSCASAAKLSVAFLLYPTPSIYPCLRNRCLAINKFLIVGFRRYESCTRCLATVRLEHTYFLRYFGPLCRMSHFSLLILFLILIQSDKRGK